MSGIARGVVPQATAGNLNSLTQERNGMTHGELILAARKWLLKTCPIVVTEIATQGEEPDAIGWQSSGVSILVECKATRSDFRSDSGKYHRAQANRGIGQARYYITPKGLILEDELPENWGLIEFDGKRYHRVRDSGIFSDYFHTHEKTILISVIRRIGKTRPEGVSISPYFYTTQNRATLSLEIDEEAPSQGGEAR